MPKSKPKLSINLNLLKPQSNPEKIPIKILIWLLSSGRYLFVVVNALVLIAVIARFKLDADLATKKEAIAEQVPYIESLRPYELLIKDTQLKLSTIDLKKRGGLDWPLLLKKIADQIPIGTTITSINIDNKTGSATVHISGQTAFNNDISNFVAGLKGDSTFSSVNLASVSLEKNTVKFTIDTQARLIASGGKSL